MSYCTTCGKDLILKPGLKVPSVAYDRQTGKEKPLEISDNQKICRSLICGHWGIDHEMEYPGMVSMLFWNDIVKCKNCGFARKMHDGII